MDHECKDSDLTGRYNPDIPRPKHASLYSSFLYFTERILGAHPMLISGYRMLVLMWWL